MARDDSGYATLLDALLFLALVSVGAALVAHTLPGTSGLEAARELRSQRLDAAALEALLAARSGVGRTLGESIGELLLAQVAGEDGAGGDTEAAAVAHLSRSLAPRDRFNLTVTWRPVPWAEPAARMAVGPPAPSGAALVERDLVLPVGEGAAEALAVEPSASPGRLLDRASEVVARGLPGETRKPWSEHRALRAAAEEAFGKWIQGGGSVGGWLAEQLRPNRARAVLAVWRA